MSIYNNPRDEIVHTLQRTANVAYRLFVRQIPQDELIEIFRPSNLEIFKRVVVTHLKTRMEALCRRYTNLTLRKVAVEIRMKMGRGMYVARQTLSRGAGQLSRGRFEDDLIVIECMAWVSEPVVRNGVH
ncbi:hypothetical protein ACOME3_008472 [Neoechinorhynchus agilis]